MTKLTRAQILKNRDRFVKWVNKHALAEFQADKGRNTVEEYLFEYSYIHDIHYRLALDLKYEYALSLYDERTEE